MVKTEVINAIAERIEGAKKGDIAVILDTYAEVITDTLKANSTESVPVGKLGKFKVKDVPARDGVSAINGKSWHTDAHKEITFKMSKTARNI